MAQVEAVIYHKKVVDAKGLLNDILISTYFQSKNNFVSAVTF